MEDDDEFEMECAALEAIFDESFRKEENRSISLAIEPITPEGELLSGRIPFPFLDWVFALKMHFPEKYPSEAPVFNLTTLENTMYSPTAKRDLHEALEHEAQTLLGDQMVYTLVEWLKDHLLHYVELSKQEIRKETGNAEQTASCSLANTKESATKEKMTKAQKRRFYSRYGAVDEKPRGWNWVDILAHLSSRPAS